MALSIKPLFISLLNITITERVIVPFVLQGVTARSSYQPSYLGTIENDLWIYDQDEIVKWRLIEIKTCKEIFTLDNPRRESDQIIGVAFPSRLCN